MGKVVGDQFGWAGSEGLREENGHLAARARCGRTVGPASASGRDPPPGQLLDPSRKRRRGRHVRECARRRGRHVRAPEAGAEKEDCHLAARHGIVGAVVLAAAARRDALGRELLHPIGEERGLGDVVEDRPGGGRRVIARAVLAAQDEDRHLGAGHRVFGAVFPAAAARRDARPPQALDRAREEIGGRDVQELGEPCARQIHRRRTRHRHDDVAHGAGRQRRGQGVDLCRPGERRAGRRSAPDRDRRGGCEARPVDRDGGTRTRRARDRPNGEDLRIRGSHFDGGRRPNRGNRGHQEGAGRSVHHIQYAQDGRERGHPDMETAGVNCSGGLAVGSWADSSKRGDGGSGRFDDESA